MLRAAFITTARRATAAAAAAAAAPAAPVASGSGRTWRAASAAFSSGVGQSPSFHLPLAARPASLEWADAPAAAVPGADATGLRRALLRLGGFYSRETRLARGARALYAAAASAATSPALLAAMGLRPGTFADEHALLTLHVWMLLVRLRPEGRDGADAAQALYENFSDDVEVRVRAAGVRVRVGKWLSELERMFYGAATAYDGALGRPGVAGAAVAPPDGGRAARAALADALLRNVFAGDGDNRAKAAAAADYVTRELACLAQTPSDAVMRGALRFSAPVADAGAEAGAAAAAAAAPKAA